MERVKSLYIITGKGGVGKTTASIALCKYLQEQKKRKVYYAYFKTSSLKENQTSLDRGHKMAESLGIPFLGLELKESAEGYITKKLKSKTIAHWIVKTPFFRALINMIPGFSYLIYLGRLLELLNEEDNNTTIVLDSPSSGHALTMLEATSNFQEIFQSGVVFEDTKKMQALFTQEDFAQINIISLPTEMAVNEARELKRDLNKTIEVKKYIYCNNMLDFSEEEFQNLPPFLKQKVENEQKVLERFTEEISSSLPHCPSLVPQEIIESIVPYMKNLV